MAQNDVLKRYLDAGLAFTQLTQARAEAIVKDLVKAGEVQTEQAQAVATDLIERSRKNTEKLLAQVRKEVRDQVASLNLATKVDIARIEKALASVIPGRTAAPAPAAKKAAPAKKAPAKKAPAKKKAAAKKAPAKKTAAKKTTAKKAPAKKAAAS